MGGLGQEWEVRTPKEQVRQEQMKGPGRLTLRRPEHAQGRCRGRSEESRPNCRKEGWLAVSQTKAGRSQLFLDRRSAFPATEAGERGKGRANCPLHGSLCSQDPSPFRGPLQTGSVSVCVKERAH